MAQDVNGTDGGGDKVVILDAGAQYGKVWSTFNQK